VLGYSSQGRAIRVQRLGDPASTERVLVVGCIHGNEAAGIAITRRLIRTAPPSGYDLWVINVVNLMKLQPQSEHPHGLSDKEFDVLFTTDKPIIFAYHGYPLLIHRLTYRRTNHHNLHVRGYKEEGTTTTPFDMVVLNDLDRFHLVADVIDRVPTLGPRAAYAQQAIREKLIEHKRYIATHGVDMPEIRNWRCSLGAGASSPRRRSSSPRRKLRKAT